MELAVLAASASAASDSTSALSYFYTSGRRRPSVLACSSSRRPDHTALTSFYTSAAAASAAASAAAAAVSTAAAAAAAATAAAADVSNSPPLSGFSMKHKAIQADYQTPGSIALLKHRNEHVTIKLDPIPSFDGVAFVKKLFARINGTPANDTSIMLKAETIVKFGLVVAVMVLHTGFSVKSLTKHVKTQLPKEFYDSVKENVTYCLVIIICNLKNLISTANKPSILKVFMDGSPVGRTIDLKTCNDYKSLSTILQVLYPGLGIMDGTGNFELLYEDHEGLLSRVGDDLWETFIGDVRFLRVKKRSKQGGSLRSCGESKDTRDTTFEEMNN